MVGMRIYYDSKQLIITSVDGNRIKFTTSDSLSITKNKIINMYVPNHIFENKTILITNYIVDSVENGFILYENKFYTVSNYKTDIENLYGNVLVYDLNNINISFDFDNSYKITNKSDTINNKNIPISVKLNINTDSDIYFYNNDLNSITFNYCYFQKIQIDGIF